ncbi:MAG TPA: TIGR00730 family Rossman fold protein [Acidobacteriota bacterium]|nr:TIGR00730 family Rossman fold protein [Acidobacteriota bacterium]
MKDQDTTSVTPPRSFDVESPELSKLVDRLIGELEPYPHPEILREIIVTGVKLAQDGASKGDIKILRSAVKEMRHAFRVFAHYKDIPKVTIFGSARSLPSDPEFQVAVELGKRLAQSGIMVITGAGSGVMGAGHLGAGREMSFGLNILLPFEQEANQTIANDEKLINFRYFFTRKLFFVKESCALVLLPGGFGTHDEGFECLTLIQTGKTHPVPIIMLDKPGGDYWRAWQNFVENHLAQRGFISPEDTSLYYITDSVEDVCHQIRTFYKRYHSSRYVNFKTTLVIRLKEALEEDHIASLNEEFADILTSGKIEACKAFPEESDEPELFDLPRLSVPFDQHHFGRLRQLIDAINR